MEKSKQLVSEFPCITAVLSKIHPNELVFIAISKDNEGESFDATIRVKAMLMLAETITMKRAKLCDIAMSVRQTLV
jgi:hypothetical protein